MDVLRFTTALSGTTSSSSSTSLSSQSSTPVASPAPTRRGPSGGLMSMLFGSTPTSASPAATPSSGIKRLIPSATAKPADGTEGRRSPLRVASCEGTPAAAGSSRQPATMAVTATPVAQRVHVPVMRKLW